MTPSPHNLIELRRHEIEGERDTLCSRLRELEIELVDLLTAERVISRLSGASGRTASVSVASVASSRPSGKPERGPTLPSMIRDALEQLAGVSPWQEPKDVAAWIKRERTPDLRPEAVSSVMWRMWKRDELQKDDTFYALPERDEAGGATREEASPPASSLSVDDMIDDASDQPSPDTQAGASEGQVGHEKSVNPEWD